MNKCLICNNKLNKGKFYCSIKCQMIGVHRSKGNGKLYKLTCEYCKKIFNVKKSKKDSAKFCSKSCNISRLNQLYKRNSKNRCMKQSNTLKKLFKSGKLNFNGFSKSELKFGEEIEKTFNIKLEHSFWLNGKCFDYKIPNKNILIECDGLYWHSKEENKINDKIKNEIAKNNNFDIYRFSINSVNDVNNIINNNYELLNNLLKGN